MKNEAITTAVEEHYAAVARGEASACGAPVDDVARSIGYSDEELALAWRCQSRTGMRQSAGPHGDQAWHDGAGPGFRRGLRRISRLAPRRILRVG